MLGSQKCWGLPKGHLAVFGCPGFVVEFNTLNIIAVMLHVCSVFLYQYVQLVSSITKNSSSNPATIFFWGLPVNFLMRKNAKSLKNS